MTPQPDHSVAFGACRGLRRYADRLREHLEGACTGEHVEDIHQVRVSCRRLRAVLRLFEDCFDRKLIRRWRREIKRVLKRLSEARDRDVQIEFLRGVLDQIPTADKKIRPGIQRIELRWKQEREDLQPRVVQAIHRFDERGILQDIHMETERILYEIRDCDLSETSLSVVERAAGQIRLRMEDLQGRGSCLDNAEDIEGHHAMRISAKRLRYTLEISAPAFEDRLKPCIKTLKQLQTMLGDLHDCDMWVEWIAAFGEEETQRTIAYYGNGRAFRRLRAGLEYLKEDRKNRREEIFRQIQGFWRQLEEEDFWESLRQLIEVKPEDEGHDDSSPDSRPE